MFPTNNRFDVFSLREVAEEICRFLEEKGLAGLSESSYLTADLAMPRHREIFGCFNRCCGLKI